jgi:hypothetical protein
MAEIYSDLASPSVDMERTINHPDGDLVHDILTHVAIDGMRSSLYPYQCRTVSAMVARELDPAAATHPLYLALTGPEKNTFYYQPTTMEILLERPLVQQNRGGVLCEELGTGKTVMILSLILATRHQLPQPDSTALHTCAVLTPLALKYFPSEDFENARSFSAKVRGTIRVPQRRANAGTRSSVPTLREYLTHYIRATAHQTLLSRGNIHDQLEERHNHLYNQLRASAPFYHAYPDDLSYVQGFDYCSRRPKVARGPRAVLLTTATLVIVPENLFGQWRNEINKHCDTTVLRVLTIGKEDKIPSADILASAYDVCILPLCP